MVKILTLITAKFIFVSNLVLAESDLVQTIDFMNKMNAKSHVQCTNCSEKDKSDYNKKNQNYTLHQKCVMDLCGDAKTLNVSAFLNDSTYDKYVQEGALDKFTEIEGKIKEIIKAEIDKNNIFLIVLKKHLTRQMDLT